MMQISPEPKRLRLAPWLLLTAVLLGTIGSLVWVANSTRARIEHNERAWFEAQLAALIPGDLHDNDLLRDRVIFTVPANEQNRSEEITVYRARRDGKPTAAALHTHAQGYGGPLELLIAVDDTGKLLGVRVLSHQETPGIGNAFELPGSTWLQNLIGRSLRNTRNWALRKDGGEFDAFTSASITPRAIVKAVQRTLEFYQANRDRIFAAP